MRYILTIAAITGLLLGAALPIGVGLGDPACGDTTNAHQSGLTSCGSYYEDHTVDRIGVDSDGATGIVCIMLEKGASDNVAQTYYWNQCNYLAANEWFDSTIQVKRTNHQAWTNWYTDTWVSGAGSSNCGKEHQHYTNYFSTCD